VGALVLLLLGIPLVGVYEKTSEAGPKKDPKSVGPPSVMQVRATTKAARAGNVQHVLSLDQEVLVDAWAPEQWLLQLMNELGKQNIDPRAKALMDELGKQQNIDPRAKMLMDELGKQQSIDPRAKVTLDSVRYDAVTEKKNYERRKELLQRQQAINAERVRLEALPESSSQKSSGLENLEKSQTSLIEEADGLLKNRRDLAWKLAVERWLERSCLVVNGRVFKDLNPQIAYSWIEYDADGTPDNFYALRFKIVLTEANKQQWLELLGGIGLGSKPVAVSIAMVDLFEPGKTGIMPTEINPSFPAHEWQKVSLKASTDWLTWVSLVCFVLLFLIFLYYAFATKVLRDLAPDGLWHLSLARCQMAFWFFIVTGSYIFLWIVTGDYKTLTSQELLLLGISSVTGVGAYLIAEKSDPAAEKPRGSDVLTREEIDLETAGELEPRLASESEKAAQLTGAEALRSQRRVAEFKRRAEYYKKGWVATLWRSLNDLLSEANDGRPSFHRFQMIGWTLAFGVIFVRAVYYKLAMPEFSADQLLLMGISNGTYLGFKWSVTKPSRNGK
jgi:hypothetical protein